MFVFLSGLGGSVGFGVDSLFWYVGDVVVGS